MSVRKLTRGALLSAIALTIFMVEAQIPPVVPIPGVKLGLANIVTVYAVFALGGWEAAAILTVRVILGAVFSGQLMALMYSAAGGALALLLTILLKKVLTEKQIWAAGVFGAIAHNIGQIAVAIAITRTPGLLAYLPVLMVSGIIAGLFTGCAAQAVVNRIRKIRK